MVDGLIGNKYLVIVPEHRALVIPAVGVPAVIIPGINQRVIRRIGVRPASPRIDGAGAGRRAGAPDVVALVMLPDIALNRRLPVRIGPLAPVVREARQRAGLDIELDPIAVRAGLRAGAGLCRGDGTRVREHPGLIIVRHNIVIMIVVRGAPGALELHRRAREEIALARAVPHKPVPAICQRWNQSYIPLHQIGNVLQPLGDLGLKRARLRPVRRVG